MSDPVDPLANETIARTFVLREKINTESFLPHMDIHAHESPLVQSESGKHRIYERGTNGWGFTDVPSPVSGENVRAKITGLRNKTESYEVYDRVFDKQIHGQKVEKTVTFGDLNNYSANDKRYNEDYHFASNNCQDYQEQFLASPQTRNDVSGRFSESALAPSDSLAQISDSDGSHGIDLDSTTLPSSHDISGHGRASTTSPGNQATGFDDIIDGTLPSLFAAQAQSDANVESEARRRTSQFETHAPGILGAAENAVNCFRQGQYFTGVWNTGILAWSCAVLYSTGGAVSITVEAPPNSDGSPRVRLAVAGLISLG
ncbi:hypothetical protein COCVIDRAFT_13869 [Bipolaris victoriae FI3]|uniref:Uncharacterized protein n=1 Tax=Bipolaris victoriae (strain FI3) TaxID=930091 RepID=W7EQV4_BIPV3|nr:hypothetical protein COCVIDRAFT_13869 [Bipolaris victoriae FI3]